MSDLEKIILTSSLTIIGGLIIYVIGRIIEKIVIEPLSNYYDVIKKIDEAMTYYSNKYSNPGDCNINIEYYKEASIRLRRIACEFRATYRRVSGIYFRTNKFIVDKNDAEKIYSNLIGLSNALFDEMFLDNNLQRSSEIKNILKI